MLSPIILWGATGQAKVLAEFLPALGYRLVALFDTRAGLPPPVEGVPLYCGEAGFLEWLKQQTVPPAALVAVGGDRGRERLELQRRLAAAGCEIITAVHPRAWVAGNAVLSPGCQVLAGAAVAAEAALGAAVIVNTLASVDHECRLAEGVHVAPGATLCGLVTVGAATLIGAGAVVLPRVRIGANCVVGAGTLVTRDLPDNVIAYGNPARIIRPHFTEHA